MLYNKPVNVRKCFSQLCEKLRQRVQGAPPFLAKLDRSAGSLGTWNVRSEGVFVGLSPGTFGASHSPLLSASELNAMTGQLMSRLRDLVVGVGRTPIWSQKCCEERNNFPLLSFDLSPHESRLPVPVPNVVQSMS